MSTTNPQDESEVGRAADHFDVVLAGLEVLSRAAASVIYDYESMRERLTHAIVRAAAWPVSSVDDNGDTADVVTLAALEALECVADDDLENPVRGWILECPRITVVTSRLVGRRGWESTDGVEILLPRHDFTAESCLITGSSDDYAQLTVTNGPAINTRLVWCPATIQEALDVAAF